MNRDYSRYSHVGKGLQPEDLKLTAKEVDSNALVHLDNHVIADENNENIHAILHKGSVYGASILLSRRMPEKKKMKMIRDLERQKLLTRTSRHRVPLPKERVPYTTIDQAWTSNSKFYVSRGFNAPSG